MYFVRPSFDFPASFRSNNVGLLVLSVQEISSDTVGQLFQSFSPYLALIFIYSSFRHPSMHYPCQKSFHPKQNPLNRVFKISCCTTSKTNISSSFALVSRLFFFVSIESLIRSGRLMI
ncbi:hypothetical protein L1887_16975 [Cichorium endivia]|nr:hypothetical protein L1887_16975 [Cichorium endivia]